LESMVLTFYWFQPRSLLEDNDLASWPKYSLAKPASL
jgi:hypothetical protein